MKRYGMALLVAVLLVGCGNQHELEQLQGELSAVNKSNQVISDELLKFKASNFESAPKVMTQYNEMLRATEFWKTVTDKPSIAGFETAKRTATTLVLVKKLMQSEASTPDNLHTYISTTREVEDSWPDRYSDDGQKIPAELWSCHDAATLSRLTLEAVADSRATEVPQMLPLQNNAFTRCHLALKLI